MLLLRGQLARSVQAAAIPPHFSWSPGNEHSGLPAVLIGFEVGWVSACRRQDKTPGRGASVPGLVAVLEARLATIGAIAAGSLELGKLRHDRTRGRRWRASSRSYGRLSRRLSGRRCPATCTGVCRLRPPVWSCCQMFRRYDRDAGKRGGRACGLRHGRASEGAQQRG